MTATVLIAEDDEDILDLVRFPLERAGFAVLACRDGETALRLGVDERPDAAVLDVQMPRIDGLEVTRRLRADTGTRDMAILILTASVREQEVVRAFEAGADDFLRKPFRPQELPERVRVVLSSRS